MKKSAVYIILSFSILILPLYFFIIQPRGYFSKENDFTVSDTAAVTRFEIVSEDTVILSREGSSWKVNGDLPASQIAVNNFLFSFRRMNVKGISNMPDITDEKGLRVKIFEGKKKHLLRFYEINGIAFMHKEGAKKIYAVEVKGFPDIKPGEVIHPDPDHWKNKILIDLQAGEIREVSIIHPSDPENDFQIKVSEERQTFFDKSGNEIPGNLIDKEKLSFYLSYFTNIFYDKTDYSTIIPVQDAKWIIIVIDNSGRKYELKVFPLKTSSGDDMFKALVKYNDQPGYKVTRYMVLDLILQDMKHFLLE